jgi:hypothetical protein
VQRLRRGAAELDEPAKAELEHAMDALLPGAPRRSLVRDGADAVAAELAGQTEYDPAAHGAALSVHTQRHTRRRA